MNDPSANTPTSVTRRRSCEPIERHFDAIVIGAGSGGLTVAVGLSRFGKSVALIERGDIGGDCTNVGCIPSKSLLHLSAPGSGGKRGESAAILDRVRQRRDHLRDEEHEQFDSMDGITLLYGTATVTAPDRVLVEGDGDWFELDAEHIVIATGSSPRRVDLGIEPERVITNEELFELDHHPERLAIVGAGPVGLEMALAFSRLGSTVTVIEQAGQVAPGVLAEAAAVVQHRLESHGIEFLLGTRADASLEAVAKADRVLLGIGRQPNTAKLGLETVGVELDEQGHIVIDDRGRTSVSGVWATGDVTNRTGTTHGANAWSRRIIKSIVARPLPIGDEPQEPRAIFTDPELAAIGHQPEQVPSDVRRITFALPDADRGYVDELDDGLIIVDIRRLTGRIIGATIVGPRAGELIALFSLAMHAGIPFHKWYGTVWPYPSYADALGKVVDQYMGEALPALPSDALRWAKGRIASLLSGNADR